MDKKKIRKQFRDSVFKRDKYTCQICGQRYYEKDSDPSLQIINAHHITDRNLLVNGGYVKENGISVCDEKGKYPGGMSCHLIVEQWHLTNGDESKVKPEHRPENLYKKIGSSLERAKEASEKLK